MNTFLISQVPTALVGLKTLCLCASSSLSLWRVYDLQRNLCVLQYCLKINTIKSTKWPSHLDFPTCGISNTGLGFLQLPYKKTYNLVTGRDNSTSANTPTPHLSWSIYDYNLLFAVNNSSEQLLQIRSYNRIWTDDWCREHAEDKHSLLQGLLVAPDKANLGADTNGGLSTVWSK